MQSASDFCNVNNNGNANNNGASNSNGVRPYFHLHYRRTIYFGHVN
nr:MAG TPA: hypothetical protein [Caudoviricetes sp.]